MQVGTVRSGPLDITRQRDGLRTIQNTQTLVWYGEKCKCRDWAQLSSRTQSLLVYLKCHVTYSQKKKEKSALLSSDWKSQIQVFWAEWVQETRLLAQKSACFTECIRMLIYSNKFQPTQIPTETFCLLMLYNYSAEKSTTSSYLQCLLVKHPSFSCAIQ